MRARLRMNASMLSAYLLVIVLVGVATGYSSGFMSVSHVRLMLVFACFYGFAALGQTFVILGGGLDLSVPYLVDFGGLQLAVWSAHGMPNAVAIVIVIAIGAAIGAVSGLGVSLLNLPPIVVTLGVGTALEAYLLDVSQGNTSSATVGGIARTLTGLNIGPLPVIALIWIALAGVTAVVLMRTAFGRRLYAVGTVDRVARLAGIRVGRVRFWTYVVSGAAAALTGVLLAGYTRTAFLGMGDPYQFASIAAVVLGGGAILGGHGSYWGTVAGALVLELLAQLLPMFNLNAATVDILYGFSILAGVTMSQQFAARSATGRERGVSSLLGSRVRRQEEGG